MRQRPRQQPFETFYYNKVGLGEGCGCAERIIDNHEIDRLAQARKLAKGRPSLLGRLWGKMRRRSGN
jgi:hypothetical protein